MVSASSFSATFSFSFFGATTLATLSYTSSAFTHLHSPSAAEDAWRTLFGSNSGWSLYSSRIFFIMWTGMLSRSYSRRSFRKLMSPSSFFEGPQ